MYQELSGVKVMKLVNSYSYSFRVLIVCMIVALFVQLSGCSLSSLDSATVWSAKSKSPDGKIVASAETIEIGGFGTAGPPATFVHLKYARVPGAGDLILGFGNPTARPVGVTAVKMKWVTNTHLDVTYTKPANLGFQAIKADGVQITVHQTGQSMNGGCQPSSVPTRGNELSGAD